MFALRIETKILFERNEQKDCSEKPGRRQRPTHFKNHYKKTEGFALRIATEILFCEACVAQKIEVKSLAEGNAQLILIV